MQITLGAEPGVADVTFTWTEDDPGRPARDVLVRIGRYADNAHEDGDFTPYLMEHDGNGTWRKTVALPSDLRSYYQFCPLRDGELRGEHPDEERFHEILALGVVDPLNENTIGPSTFPVLAPASVLELPDAIPQPWRAKRPDGPEGKLTRHELDESSFWVYTPAGYEDTAGELPVVVLFDAKVWMPINVTWTFDNLIAAEAIPPTVVVAVDSIRGSERWVGLSRHELFTPFLLDELMPYVSENWRVTDDPRRTVIAGQSLGGLAAAYAGLHASHRFGRVLSQSGAFWWPGGTEGEVDAKRLISQYKELPNVDVTFFQEAGSLERELLETNRTLRDVLREKGYELTYREYQGGHDYSCWRGGLADGLIGLLGQQAH